MKRLAVVLAVIGLLTIGVWGQGTLDVYFLDVGQGDAILIDYGTYEMLIDGGPDGACVAEIAPYIDGHLEIVVATHPHSDHIGGLDDVLRAFEVDAVYTNGDRSATTNAYKQFAAAVDTENLVETPAHSESKITLDDLVFHVLSPRAVSGDANEDSVVLLLTYENVDFLFTGDTESSAEEVLVASRTLPDQIEVLKVAHHGSRYSTSDEFLQATNPVVAIYSAGVGNRYGHPHEETLCALQLAGAEIFGTDVDGTIAVRTDGMDIHIWSENEPIGFLIENPGAEEASISPQGVVITGIRYDGAVPYTEADEYVEITNLGPYPQELLGWALVDAAEGYPEFAFPQHTLAPGEAVRVYTNELHPQWGGFSFGFGRAIWNNDDPDVAILYNEEGVEISRCSY